MNAPLPHSPVLELAGVVKTYDEDLPRPVPVLRGIDLSVPAGESIAIMGPSGCGKSTLLNIMGTLDRPTSGSVRIEGEDLAGRTDLQLAEIRNARIGFVFQLHHLLPQCTALENVMIPALIRPNIAKTRKHAGQLLERLGISSLAGSLPGRLSGGERQRVAVARALVNQPRMILADEPTGSLDRAAADNLVDLLLEINRELGQTLIMVTHSLSLARRMHRLYSLVDGRLTEPPDRSANPDAPRSPPESR